MKICDNRINKHDEEIYSFSDDILYIYSKAKTYQDKRIDELSNKIDKYLRTQGGQNDN
jgi:hypothetical protein